MARKRRAQWADLAPYTGCNADLTLGIDPIAIGWLEYGSDFPTAKPNSKFVTHLAAFCQAENHICRLGGRPQPCPLAKHTVPALNGTVLGSAEIRVIGDEEIYASPTLIYHYVVDHHYAPPAEFIEAVLHGPQPHSAEYRALIRTLQMI